MAKVHDKRSGIRDHRPVIRFVRSYAIDICPLLPARPVARLTAWSDAVPPVSRDPRSLIR